MLEFSKILAAVGPKERSDQYVILAALYSLGALRSPVTTSQVTKLLKLHSGACKLPANATASMRSYTGLVDPSDKDGSILKWQLTQDGLDKLRTLSGLALAAPITSASFGTDVGIVCALEQPEMAAVLKAVGGKEGWEEVPGGKYSHLYRRALLARNDGDDLELVATVSTSMGLTAAAIATTNLVWAFRPRLVVMIGIAAGTKSKDKQVGDVLVADPSVDFNSGKIIEDNGKRKFWPDPYPIGLSARLRSILKRYSGAHPVFETIRKRWHGTLPPTSNRLHLGPLGASDLVVDDLSRVVEVQEHWRKLIGIEMESYAVYRACWEAPEPKPVFVSFKSVCDFAADKTDLWQEFAAHTAAEFAVTFLSAEWDNLWHET